ncbi:MAG: TonB C-terminal domain-containing protein [Burkholderiales bacterium]|nr:TonB C-terminal domain-containing protein [Burkholderiales bacterium]
MAQARHKREPGALPSAVLATGVHLALVAVLVFGVSWQSRRPETVTAELWPRLPEPPVVRQQRPEPKPQVQPPPLPRPAPKPVPETPKKPDIAVAAKKAPPKKPAVEEPPLDLDFRRRMERQLAEELTLVQREQLKTEPVKKPPVKAPVPSVSAPSVPAVAVDPGYVNRVRAKIRGNITLPAGLAGNPEAIFEVEQLPTGEVLSVKLRTSSGEKAYDDSVERAILKSSPLPRPEPGQYQRRLELRFRPME